jgi:outer membrane protein assembly factor BamB
MTPLLWVLVSVIACKEPVAVERAAPWILWQAASDVRTGPLLIDSLAVFGTRAGEAIAYNQTTGRVVWSNKVGEFVWGRRIETAAGLVIVPEYALFALDRRTGALRWRLDGPDGTAGVNAPAIAADTLFVASRLGWAAAVNAQTGQASWGVDLGEALFEPTLAGDLVIYGTRGFEGGPRQGPLGAGRVVALRRSDGSVAWTFPLPDSVGFPGSGGAVNGGVVWRDRVILGSFASRLYALRLSDGALLWEHVGGSPTLAPYEQRPVLLNETVIAFRDDGALEALDPSSGTLKWTRAFGGTSGSGPTVARSALYLANGPFSILNEKGDLLWQWGGGTAPVLFLGEPAVDDQGRVYVHGARPDAPVGIAYGLVPPVRP